MLPVSVWMRKMDLKQALKDGSGGRWPLWRKSLSWSQAGRFLKYFGLEQLGVFGGRRQRTTDSVVFLLLQLVIVVEQVNVL